MKALKIFIKVMPHALLVVTGMFITFLIIDAQNSIIGMIDSDISKAVMWVWCALSIVASVTLIYIQRREARRQADREVEKPESASLSESEIERLEQDLELLLDVLRKKRL